jgi:signal transduction histidine kinase
MVFDSKDDFDVLNSFAHDLKAPLGSVRNFAQMVEQAGELNPQQQSYLQRIYKSVDRMLMLINDMLSTAQIESQDGLQLDKVDLKRLVHGALEVLETMIVAKELQIAIDIRSDAQIVYGDDTWLSHAILNVVGNAVKYNKVGGRVTISTQAFSNMVQVDVSDTGVGIPADALPKVFDKFFRSKTVRNIEGTGLGLSIVKSVIEQHRGKVDIRSELGMGTTITLRIPRQETQTNDYDIFGVEESDTDPIYVTPIEENLDPVDDDSQEGVDGGHHERTWGAQ